MKPAAPQADGQYRLTMRGGPGSDDPGQISYTSVSVLSILRIAYDAYPYQIVGPSWLGVNGYDITAKIPPGTTKQKFNLMLANLLAERLHTALHHETREVQGYELVTGKNGSKLKESASDEAAAMLSGPARPDSAGFPVLDHPGVAMAMKMGPDAKAPSILMTFKAQPLTGLMRTLGEELGRPVTDKTGVLGKYDFTLEFTPARRGPSIQPSPDLAEDFGLSIVTAIQEQPGLKVEPRRVPLDMLIVDHADKVPSSN